MFLGAGAAAEPLEGRNVWFSSAPLQNPQSSWSLSCEKSLSPQSFQEVFYILSPSNPLLPSISHLLQSFWNASYRGSNPLPQGVPARGYTTIWKSYETDMNKNIEIIWFFEPRSEAELRNVTKIQKNMHNMWNLRGSGGGGAPPGSTYCISDHVKSSQWIQIMQKQWKSL
jgi:hypothetical protein